MNALTLTWRPLLPWAAVALGAAAVAATLASALSAPLWLVGLIALAPALPVLAAAVVITARAAGGWLALYVALAISQTGHVGEHVVQIAQLRLLALSGEHAHGVFGALDVEWVHFGWNAWILLAVGLLLTRFGRNPWLWVTLPLAGWHMAEHVVVLATYLGSGVAGSPGLLASGGLVGGGLPIARPDLHLLYNVAETVPLLVGLWWQWRRLGHSPRLRTASA